MKSLLHNIRALPSGVKGLLWLGWAGIWVGALVWVLTQVNQVEIEFLVNWSHAVFWLLTFIGLIIFPVWVLWGRLDD